MKLFNVSQKGELLVLEKLDFLNEDVYLIDDSQNHTIYVWVGNDVDQNKKDTTARLARKIDKEKGGSCKILIMKQKREYGSFMVMMDDLKKGLIPGETTEKRPELKLEVPSELHEEAEDDVTQRIVAWFTQVQSLFQPVAKLDEIPAIETIQVEEEKDESLDSISWLRQYVSSREITAEEIVEMMKKEGISPSFLDESDDSDFESKIRLAAYFISLSKNTYNELCWYLAEKIQTINLGDPDKDDIKSKAEEIFLSSSTYDELCWLNAEMDILTKKSFLEKKKKIFNY